MKTDASKDYLSSFCSGEESGFNFFFKQYYQALCYFSFQFVKNSSMAEEIAADAMMKLWERHSGFENTRSIRSFLYATTRNASIDHLRRQKIQLAHQHDTAFHQLPNERFVLEKIVESETIREIVGSLRSLPPQCRQIFRMLFIEGKDYTQVAAELKLSVNTIRVQKARALARLREQLITYLLPFTITIVHLL